MPNIVITEGLDTPWELKDTESNITAATDLTSINLANQTVGTLAYTSSQLLGSLKTEKNNLDNIVDAIELINEEIALFPGRIAKWDAASQDIEKIDLSVFPIKFEYRPLAATQNIDDTTLSTATVSLEGLQQNQKALDAIKALIAAKPLLDAQNVSYSRMGAVILFPTDPTQNYNAAAISFETKVVEGTTPGTGGNDRDLVVYRDSSGKPTSYEYVFDGGRTAVDASRVSTFFIPKDAAERDSMQAAINGAALIEATNALINTTGLPSGVTPPVTTLGPSVEKYYDKAKYIFRAVNQAGETETSVIYGDYPPLSPPDLDLSNITTNEIGKIFLLLGGGNQIVYVTGRRNNGQAIFKKSTSTEPFINKMTTDLNKTLRGEYAEKQILLTQRGTDQTLFVTSITQRYTTFSDMATNLLKTLVNFYNDLARNLRG